MTELNVHRWKLPPFKHQVVGVQRLVEKPAFAIFDQMGLGKSKQAVDAACELYTQSLIDLVVVLCPAAAVQGVWLDRDFGELVTHLWVPYVAYRYNSKGLVKVLESQPSPPRLGFVVTNYESLRKVTRIKRRRTYPRVDELGKLVRNRRVLLIVDESSYCAYPDSAQTRATYRFRDNHTDRVVLLNGTPQSNPGALYPQFKILDPNIIGVHSWTEFKNQFCRLDIYGNVAGYSNGEELMKRTAPYVLRRTKEECLDLPAKLYERREVALSRETWKYYQDMRDNMVTWLDTDRAATAATAVVKAIRLSQLCSGILAGVDGEEHRVVSDEKVSFVADLIKSELPEKTRLIVWTRFRLERQHLYETLVKLKILAYQIYGGQKESERGDAIRIFSGDGSAQPAVLLAQPRAGGIGLNLTTAATAIYISTDYSHLARTQSEDRIHRIGQTKPCTILDVLATGPAGQRTIDHIIMKALLQKDDLERWTTKKWREELLAA